MTTFVALLRGVNVSGKKPIPMAELRKSCEGLGLGNVRTYLQSGNVVFSAERMEPRKLTAALKGRIKKDFGYEVDTLALPGKELKRIADSNPLRRRLEGEDKLFHATFLFEPVSAELFKKLTLPAQPGEEALLIGQAVLLYCPHGYGNTKLNNTFFEKKLGVPATTRNWRTVLALQALCAEP